MRLDGRLKFRDDVRSGRLFVYAERMRRGLHRVSVIADFGPDRLRRTVRFKVCG